jgi:hypothetical protein
MRSETLHPDEMTALIGVEPDFIRLMGARQREPKPVPRFNIWGLGWRDEPNGLSLDEQLTSLEGRLRILETPLSQLSADPNNHATLHIVRNLIGELSTQVLGLGVEPSFVELLGRLRSRIDIDEYPYDSRASRASD